MNQNSKYLIPAFAAIFALAFVFAPAVMADDLETDDDAYDHDGENHFTGDHGKWDEKSHHGPKGMMGPHVITIDGFSGAVALPQEMTKESHDALKDAITVTLSQAASIAEENGLTDSMMAHIGVVDDGEGNKYLAWIVSSMNKDDDTSTMTANIFVVDAGNASNFAQTSNTFDHFMMKDRMHGDKAKFENHSQKSDTKFSETKTQFHDLIKQLRDAYKSGDSDAAQSIKDQLNELKQSFISMKNSEL